MDRKGSRGSRVKNRSWLAKQPAWIKVAAWGLKLFLFALSLVVVFLILVYIGLFGKIPSYQELKTITNHEASVVYSSDGIIIGKFFVQNRQSINNDKIPAHVKNALVATEDSRFFNHGGIDIPSIGRVLVRTLILRDHAQGGGSTIGQQLARNLYPRENHGILSTPVNKAREIFISYRLERVYTKEEILGLYLNTVPFGEEVFGIEAAARRFFNKPASNLSVPEAATLVGLLAANTTFSPRLNPELSLQRRNVVLDRMASGGYISRTELEKYKSTPLRTNYARVDHHHGPAPYFLEQVRLQAQAIIERELGNKYNVFTDGLRFHTTLDATLQRFAVRALREQMSSLQRKFNDHWSGKEPWHSNPSIFAGALRRTPRYRYLAGKGMDEAEIIKELSKPVLSTVLTPDGEKRMTISPVDSLKNALRTLHAGFVAINLANGHVLAWEGGINFRFFKFDHVTARRQTGSTFKPIVYATALNLGYDPCEFISNKQRVYPGHNNWSPENADGNHEGYYSLKGALVHSSNTVSAEIIHKTGVGEVLQTARRMGIQSDIPRVPSIALGSVDLSLLELTSAYTAFANYGQAVSPVIILRIDDNQGNVLYQAPGTSKQAPAFNEETARLMVQVMRETVAGGTASSLYTRFNLQGDYAGKTGTSQNNADGWFIGFTPTIVAGAWVGAENPGIHFRTLALGQGAHTALPIFGMFMQQAERSVRHQQTITRRFYPLPDYLAAMINCENYSETPPREMNNFLRRLFKDDGQREYPRGEDEPNRGKNILERARDIFREFY